MSSFELGGRQWTLRPKIPWQITKAALIASTSGRFGDAAPGLEDYLTYAVVRDQRAEFAAFLHSDAPEEDDDPAIFDDGDLMRAFQEATARTSQAPFRQSSESTGSSNRRNGASTSVDDSRSTESTTVPLVQTSS